MSKQRRNTLFVSLTAGLLLVACQNESNNGENQATHANHENHSTPANNAENNTSSASVTYHADVAPIVSERCLGCHAEGGIGPLRFETYEQFSTLADVALDSIKEGSMPPWMPDPDCRHFQDERLMPAEEVEVIEAWIAAGKPEGDPSTAQPLEPEAPVESIQATHTLPMPEPYTADTDKLDDYRCFVLDLDTSQDRYLRASQVIPGDDLIVHHVLVYALDQSLEETVRNADEMEEGPGYTCFGSPLPSGEEASGNAASNFGSGGSFPNQIGAWVPGSVPQRLDDNVATRIDKGSLIVMQVHYNLLNPQQEPDETELLLELTDEKPEFLTTVRPLPILDFEIPAGEGNSVWTRPYTNYGEKAVTIRGMSPHMHQLGKSFTARLTRGGEQSCGLDIPAWDFAWQQNYRVLPGEDIVLEPGDTIEVECAYDNSPSNQPIVDGNQIMPEAVTWGEGTLDEMCLLYLQMVEPYSEAEPAPEVPCEPVQGCVDACGDEPSLDCILSCEEGGLGCTSCVLQEGASCMPRCIPKVYAMRDCLTTCAIGASILGSNLGECMKAECGVAYGELLECADPLVADGSCDEALTTCGASF